MPFYGTAARKTHGRADCTCCGRSVDVGMEQLSAPFSLLLSLHLPLLATPLSAPSLYVLISSAFFQVQETELRSRPDIVICTPGRLIDHIRNSQTVHLEVHALLAALAV